MKRWNRLIVALALMLLLSACGRKPAGAVVVYEDHLVIVGAAKVTFPGGIPGLGTGQMNPWRPGNAAVFRVDRTIQDSDAHLFAGRAGKVYWITDKFELEEIGQADLAKTDDDIARQFGVEVKK